jgi:3-oxoacyl-[acyl-carrier protein] reductase
MPNSNRRIFLKNMGQGTMAASLCLGLSKGAWSNANAAEAPQNDNVTREAPATASQGAKQVVKQPPGKPPDQTVKAPNMFTLKGRTAIVAGGSGGVSREIVRWFLESGMNVAIMAHGDRLANSAKEGLGELGKDSLALGCEMNADDIKAKIKVAADKFGGLDVLVCSQGAAPSYSERDMETLTIQQLQKAFETHLRDSYILMKESLPYLEKSKAGRVIFLASSEARMGSDDDAMAYNILKGGVITLTYDAARRLAKKGITVNCIAMGGIYNIPTGLDSTPRPGTGPNAGPNAGPSTRPKTTAPGSGWFKEDVVKVDRIPIGRAGKPEDVAAAACYLASEEAGYVTGEILNVSGGLYMGS